MLRVSRLLNILVALALFLSLPNITGNAQGITSVYKTPLIGQDPAIAKATGISIKSIAAGTTHTCALTTEGGVKCWGANYNGELGDGTNIDRWTPVDVVGLSSGVTAISTSEFDSCALTINGGVKCWGYNYYGQLGDGTTTDRWTPVDVIGLSSGVSTIAVGVSHTCVLLQSGGVKCWGDNHYSQLGDGTTTDRWTPVVVSVLSSPISAIATGWYYTCVVTTEDGAKCWGYNSNGQLGDGTTTQRLTPVDVVGMSSGTVAIAAGNDDHTCALTSGGGVKCWGRNETGQLGDGTTTNSYTPVDVLGLSSGVVTISSGGLGDHTCALTTGSGVKCWGFNYRGQLGDGTTTQWLIPVDVVGLSSGVVTISAGGWHTCALTDSSGVKCWGSNSKGQLGDGTTTDRLAPVDVVGLTANSAPSAFAKTIPSNTAIGLSTSPILSWASSSGATSYEYCYDTTNDNACSSWTSTSADTSVDLSGLSPNTTYYWQVRAVNSTGTTYADGTATAFWSFTTGNAPDVTPPDKITSLSTAIGDVNGGIVSTTLSWIAPGDVGSSGGTATQYDIRYSSSPLTNTNWDAATKAMGIPTPGAPGSNQSITISILATNKQWYFGIKTVDDVGNWSELSNIPSIQDSGFRPNPSGYNFDNYGDSPTSDFTIDDMRAMLGDDAVCQMVKDGKCTPKTAAQKWDLDQIKAMQGGHCSGMSTTAWRFFKGWDLFSKFQQSASTTYSLEKANIRRQIAYFWTMQVTEPFQTTFNAGLSKTPDQVLADLQNALSGTSSPDNLVIYNRNPFKYQGCNILGIFNCTKGHAVNPYAIQEVGDGIWRIWVYDNNHSGDLIRYVEINVPAKTWKYDSLYWSGDATSHSIAAVPVDVNLTNAIGDCPWCSPDGKSQNTQIWTSPNISLVVKDGLGRRFGNDGTNTYDEIPGAYNFLPPSDLNPTIAPIVFLPPDQQYTVQIVGATASTNILAGQSETSNSFTQYSTDQAVSVGNITNQDQITVGVDQVSLTPSISKNGEVQLFADDSSGSYTFSISQMPLDAAQSIDVRYDSSVHQVFLRNSNSPSGDYDLGITMESIAGIKSFGNDQIQIGPNETQIINLSTWNNDGLTIDIDKNNDGTIDQTIKYNNQGQGTKVYLPLTIR
jgi:alpha-tubulin suppressor-like RCC1 family protein